VAQAVPSTVPAADPVRQRRRRRDVVGNPEPGWLKGRPGHDADHPKDIPAVGWWAVARRVGREAISDEIGMVSASCAYYALLAIFPALSVLISLYGLVANPSSVENQLEAVRDFLPATTFELIAGRVHDLVTLPPTRLGWGLALGLAIALWTAMAGMKALITSLNIAYEEPENRSFLRLNLTALLFTLGGIFGTAIALTVIVGLPTALQWTWLGPWATLGIRLVTWFLLAAAIVLGLSILYRFGPSRADPRWRWVTPGSLVAALLWLAASALFSFYVGHFGNYDTTYGSLGAVAVAMIWLYLSAFVVVLGAELNAELELQTSRDTTSGPELPMGSREAFVADHVAVR
jgi:membrane protein